MIKKYHVSTLSDFYDVISEIGRQNEVKETSGNKQPCHLWYRGHAYNYYSLMPSIHRGNYYDSNTGHTYSEMNLKEDYRYQHIKSRAFHSVKSNPVYESEWQEIYQHHLGHTRLMDWSESAKTALSFALECFVDTRDNKKLEYERQHLTPCIWILNPYKLNEKVYDYIADNSCKNAEMTFERALENITVFKNLKSEMKRNKKLYFDCDKGDIDIKGLISLCVLEDYRRAMGGQLAERVKSFEFNPFYYMALRLYSDSLPFVIDSPDTKLIPPLAVLHPYHSERIRAQRGAFTVFPNYILQGKARMLAENRGIDLREMERQSYIEDCIQVIYILNPNKVAEQLIFSGERRSELYPDIETYAEIIETSKFYY